ARPRNRDRGRSQIWWRTCCLVVICLIPNWLLVICGTLAHCQYFSSRKTVPWHKVRLRRLFLKKDLDSLPPAPAAMTFSSTCLRWKEPNSTIFTRGRAFNSKSKRGPADAARGHVLPTFASAERDLRLVGCSRNRPSLDQSRIAGTLLA